MNETELLFTQVLNCSRSELYLNKKINLGTGAALKISSALKRRILGEPIQYILGRTEFMGLEFLVNNDVFIPRPETEILVETAVTIGCKSQVASHKVKILDLGTGSGCIAVSLAKFLPDAKVVAIDISDQALKVAQRNAQLHNVKVEFFKMDLTEPRTLNIEQFNIIVANPPYIPSREIGDLQIEVQQEPRIALDGGKDGLDFYRRIIKCAPEHLKKSGYLVMEMGFGQRKAIEEIIRSGGMIVNEVVKDYSGIDRVIVAQGA